MKKVYTLLLVLIVMSCNSNTNTTSSYESETLKIEQISETIFKHISYLDTKNDSKFPCNGMIYINNNEAIIFDTPTNNEASAELINWIGKRNIKAVVVTHFHIDCLGGLDQLHLNEISTYANNLTIELAKKDNQTLPKHGFDKRLEIKVGNETVIAEYFGQGHTKDNIVGYVPSEKTMFGGCLIKPLNSGKGNLADANTSDWPKTIEAIKKELPHLETIIPGHGIHGDIKLLEYTIDLFSEN